MYVGRQVQSRQNLSRAALLRGRRCWRPCLRGWTYCAAQASWQQSLSACRATHTTSSGTRLLRWLLDGRAGHRPRLRRRQRRQLLRLPPKVLAAASCLM